MKPVPEPSSEPSPEPVPTPEPQPSEPEPDPPQLEPVIEPSTEHELEPVDSDSESEPDVGLMLLFSKAVVRALPAPSLSPDDPSDPVVDMVHQGQEFDPSEFIEPISGPSQNWTVHQITEESASGVKSKELPLSPKVERNKSKEYVQEQVAVNSGYPITSASGPTA
ncbi:hypothetical protein MRB53_036386 [Persea americana]|nr:hypothetical protein MRB53_036386 [Persea americana]